MQVFVVDKHKKPLTPCRPKRARILLRSGRAVVARRYPFTIRIKDRVVEESVVKPVRVKIDPGSRYTGIAVVQEDANAESSEAKQRLIAGIEIEHRGKSISESMTKRANYRRRRRSANTRYRKPRFDNRTRPEGWIPPSLKHRVDTTISWVERLMKIAPVQGISVESVRFDTQKLNNPEISGVEYQQGELLGYEVREYLLEKWGRKCAYCGTEGVPLEVEHIIPKSRGGSNRVSNLTLSCRKCNQKKGSRTAEEFGFPEMAKHAQKPLRDAAAVNATRNALVKELASFGLPVETGSGGRTKYNRMRLGIPKSHVFDALCVGKVDAVSLDVESLLHVKCSGRGRYARTLPDAYGFPRTYLPRTKRFFGFATGDMVRANVPKGKYQGTYTGRIAVRKSGYFALSCGKEKVAVKWDTCTALQRADGYGYMHTKIQRRWNANSSPTLEEGEELA
jgi:5-methylcytosine-specific restriction endonuclease McrA